MHNSVVADIKDGDDNTEGNDELKLDQNPIAISVIDFLGKKILVRAHQGKTTHGKNVIVSDEYRAKMRRPKSSEVGLGIWKVNEQGRSAPDLNIC